MKGSGFPSWCLATCITNGCQLISFIGGLRGTGALGLALLLGGTPAGLIVLQALVYIGSLPTTLAYAALATAYHWHLRAVVHLWAAFCGRCNLLPTTAKAGTGLAAWLAKPVSGNVPSLQTLRRESLGELGVQPQPSLPNLTASILLLVPQLLLLPTLAVFYGSVCALHCLGMAVRLLIYCAWQSASRCNSLQGAKHHGVSQQQECKTAKCKGASFACQERSGGSSLGFAPRPAAALLKDVLLHFLQGYLVGHQPLWPACV